MIKINIYYVYAWIRDDYNTPFYIGKGKNARCYRLDNRKSHFMNIYNKVPCHVEFIATNLTEEQALKLEKEVILKYINNGYSTDIPEHKVKKNQKQHLVNMTYGGEGTSGFTYKQSEKTIKNRTIKLIGKKRTNIQKSHIRKGINKALTESDRERLRNLRKGSKCTLEHKLKISKAHLGKTLTESHKKSISDGVSKIMNETLKRKIQLKTSEAIGTKIYCIELKKEFISIAETNRYFKENYNQSFNKTQFRLLMQNKTNKDWYKEVEIDGKLTKLHWKYI